MISGIIELIISVCIAVVLINVAYYVACDEDIYRVVSLSFCAVMITGWALSKLEV